jgi:small-conductance mechanosensitive channel
MMRRIQLAYCLIFVYIFLIPLTGYTQVDSLRFAHPVLGLFNDTLFQIYCKQGSFTSAERANAVSERIKKIAEDDFYQASKLRIDSSENSIDIVYNDLIVSSTSNQDAELNNTTPYKLSLLHKKIISDEINKYKNAISFKHLGKEIALTALVLLSLIMVLYLNNKLFRWLRYKARTRISDKFSGIKIRNYVLFDAKQLSTVLVNILSVFKWIFIVLAIYISLPIVFAFFPWTKNYTEVLLGYFIDPLKNILLNIWNYLPNLITILVIVFVFRYIIKLLKYLKAEVENGSLVIPGFYVDWANPTFQIIRILIFAFMLIVIFPYLPGSDSPVFRGVSVFLGFLFTFGSAGSLSNIVSGLILTYMRLFKIGDFVKIAEVTGNVVEKSLLVTRIRTIKNEIISIPNSTIMNSHTVNYSSEALNKGLILHTTVTIGYDTPWKDMHQALIDAALQTNMVLQEPRPFVLQTALNDFYISYQLNVYTREADLQAEIYSELHQQIQDVCAARGIEIMSPHYFAKRDGSESTIPR